MDAQPDRDQVPTASFAPVGGELDTDDDGATGARRKRRRSSSRRNTVEWVLVVAGALLVAIVIKTFLFQAFYIPSASMEPTLKVGDRVLVNKLSYRVHDVNHSDIVVFERPPTTAQQVDGCDGQPVTFPGVTGGQEVKDLIKRVIALPGETVEVRAGKVFVQGVEIVEPYLKANESTPQDFKCIKVPANDVFVMGDNRNNSMASNRFGPIKESSIVGRAFVRVWPLGSFSGL
ncbi:MAG: signal peptidase [Acidimicrobiaceae bacterium]